MWSVTHLCRCTSSLRTIRSKLLVPTTRSGISITSPLSRQLVTPVKYNYSHKGFRLSNTLKSNGIVVRLCSAGPKPKNPKVVGYWLLGCSGMVFTAVVLGMVSGYFVLLYSIYYVVNTVVRVTNATK